MALSNLYAWTKKDKAVVTSASCGSSCGSGGKLADKPSGCGSACGSSGK